MGVDLNSRRLESRFVFQAICWRVPKIIPNQLRSVTAALGAQVYRAHQPLPPLRPSIWPLGMVVPLIACHFRPPQVYAPERDEHAKSAAAAAALGPTASYLCTPEAHGNASRGLWPL